MINVLNDDGGSGDGHRRNWEEAECRPSSSTVAAGANIKRENGTKKRTLEEE